MRVLLINIRTFPQKQFTELCLCHTFPASNDFILSCYQLINNLSEHVLKFTQNSEKTIS